MEAKLYKDTLQKSELVCSQKYEHPVEVEILIPDYLPAIFKIVKTLATPVVLQKQISGGRYVVDGYLRLTMLYQPEGQEGLCAVEQKVPFQKQFEMKAGPYHNHFGEVTGELGYLNCRAVNQRRIDVRGAYYFTLRVFAQCEQEVVTAVAGGGICQKTQLVASTALAAQGDKQFTLEEEVQFPQPPAAVLYSSCQASVAEVKVISGKAVVKGEVKAEVTYRAEGDEEALQKAYHTLSFNQIVDMEAGAEGCRPVASVEVPGCTIAADGTNVTMTVTCILALRFYRETEQYLVCDAFSTRAETQVTTQDVTVDVLQDSFSNTLEAKVGGTLPEENAEIQECLVTLHPPELVGEEGRLTIRGKVTAHLVCRNALGELECYDKSGEYILPKRYKGRLEDTFLLCNARVLSVAPEKNGADAEVAITLQISGEVMSQYSKTVLETLEETGPLERDNEQAALVIYYAQRGEDIFYIAKHYHADPADIGKLAGLAGDTIEEDCQLLIPAAEQEA